MSDSCTETVQLLNFQEVHFFGISHDQTWMFPTAIYDNDQRKWNRGGHFDFKIMRSNA